MKIREIQNFKRNILYLGVSDTLYLKLLYYLSSLSEAMAEAVPGSLKERGLEFSIFHLMGSPDGHGAAESIGLHFISALSTVDSVGFHNTSEVQVLTVV
jgi:hypothetical protein